MRTKSLTRSKTRSWASRNLARRAAGACMALWSPTRPRLTHSSVLMRTVRKNLTRGPVLRPTWHTTRAGQTLPAQWPLATKYSTIATTYPCTCASITTYAPLNAHRTVERASAPRATWSTTFDVTTPSSKSIILRKWHFRPFDQESAYESWYDNFADYRIKS